MHGAIGCPCIPNKYKRITSIRMTNRLGRESSPYLLQHAENPVDWYPWGSEALDKAREQNMPIFLSIGYSSCHWCHVMAHESFENENIADTMNRHFINIKVDREERPDIDDIYQKACQMATGSGGWPLSVFLTPDQKPFYIGTYFPIMDMNGKPVFESVLLQMAQTWREKSTQVQSNADGFVQKMNSADVNIPSDVDHTLLDQAASGLMQIADMTNGGFGTAPKFPNSANISFMLAYSRRSKNPAFRKFALKTLDRMARGGIFDQVGGGFHRYSTDAMWLVPHFEKMLYDNALIPVNYAEAYQITGQRIYLETLQKTLDYVLREMRSAQGGFFSAQDADSESEEGRFYVWTKPEIRNILGSDADLFCLYYNVTDGGNWEGKTILYNNMALSTAAFQCGVAEDEARDTLNRCSKKLLKVRQNRTHPGLDDKILVSWNALMITGLVRGYRVTDDVRYIDAALDATEFITGSMMHGARLYRVYRDGAPKIYGYLDDYAYFASALLDIFEARPDAKHLRLATDLADYVLDHFWDETAGGFFMNEDGHETLIVRPRSNYDLSLPSGNSVAAGILLRIYRITGNSRYMQACKRIVESNCIAAAQNPFAFGHLLNVIMAYVQKPTEITILDANGHTGSSITKRYLPEAMIVTVSSQAQLDKLDSLPFFAGKKFEDSTVSFVCRDSVCSPPMRSVEELDARLASFEPAL